MADRLEALQSKVEELVDRLARLEARVRELEGGRSGMPAVPDGSARLPCRSVALPRGTVALAGRSLLVLAGAYVVRALTDGRVVPAGRRASRWASPTPPSGSCAPTGRRARRARERGLPRPRQQPDRLPAGLGGDVPLRPARPERPRALALVAFFAARPGCRLAPAAGRERLAHDRRSSLATAVALLVSTHDLLAVLAGAPGHRRRARVARLSRHLARPALVRRPSSSTGSRSCSSR